MAGDNLNLSKELQTTIESQPIELIDVDRLETMSVDEFKQQKDLLANMRQQVMLHVDGKKLEENLKVLAVMDKIFDIMINSDLKPSEMNAYTKSLRDLSAMLPNFSRMDTIDGYGGSKRFYIDVSEW